MGFLKKSRRGIFVNNAVLSVFMVVFVSCLLLLLVSMLRLPNISRDNETMGFYRGSRKLAVEDKKLGVLGEMMVGMLPDDLAFTVFVPSERVLTHDLKLRANGSLADQQENDNTYATLSHILGFSAVPRSLPSVVVPLRKEVSFDSISGFKLYISREQDGSLLVNRIRSTRVDLKRREIIIHIMDGAIMDSDFEQSVRPEFEDGRLLRGKIFSGLLSVKVKVELIMSALRTTCAAISANEWSLIT